MTKPTRSPAQNLASAKRIATTINIILVAALGAFSYMTFKRHYDVPVPAEGILFSEIRRDDYHSDTPNFKPQTPNSVPTTDMAGLENLLEQLKNSPTIPPDEAQKAVQDNIVQIMLDERQVCSGLLLTNDGWIATAAHCLPLEATPVSYGIRYQERDYEITAMHHDPVQDVMLVKADMCLPNDIPLPQPAGDRNGQQVTMYGFYDGNPFEKKGEVTGYRYQTVLDNSGSRKTSNTLLSIPIRRGMSGSMVVDDATGGLVGMLVELNLKANKQAQEAEGVVLGVDYLVSLVDVVAGK